MQEKHTFAPNSLRDPADLMHPERLGALKQTRLSFTRLLIDRMVEEGWDVYLERIDVDNEGVGRLVYAIETPSRRFSFGVFSRTSSEDEDTDRIIAQEWDMWAFLCEGTVSPEFMQSQYEELPEVIEGRAGPEVLIWVRANRSSRFFDHVVDSLAAGHQPDIEFLSTGGYLMRSSGYYGNGHNATKMFAAMDDDHPLKLPYFPQMLAVYMLRVFGYDLAEEVAAARSAEAVTLDDDIKRYLGTGNSSGVGCIMYVVNHPRQINSWLRARETALARAKATDPTDADVERFVEILTRAKRWFSEDTSTTNEYFQSKNQIAEGLARIDRKIEQFDNEAGGTPLWDRLSTWAEGELEVETQEVLHSLLLDVHPEACRGLESSLITSEKNDLVPEMRICTLRSYLESSYQWALDIDFTKPGARQRFWYRSVDNEEPRIGIRGEHDAEEYELPVDIARQVQHLECDLEEWSPTDTIAEFLFAHPEHRSIVERVQSLHGLPYAEIQANPLDEEFVPLYFISVLKSFWGISKTHPKSMGWVRGTFFQGAPLATELDGANSPYWVYPPQPEQAEHWREER